LRVIRDLRKRPQSELSFQQLEVLRGKLGEVGKDPNTGKIVSPTAARIASKVQDELDNFIANATPAQVTAGNAQAAAKAVTDARAQWSNARKGEILEKVLSDVELKSGKRPAIDVLRSRLEPIVADKRLMAKFTPEEREVIKSIQSGTPTENVLAFLGRASPGTNWKQILGYAVPAGGAAALQSPTAAGVVSGIAAGSAAAQAAANRMAMSRAADLTQNMLRGLPPGTTAENYMRNIGRMGSTYVPPVISGSAFANQENQNRMSR
jgi:hypothetical protein